MLPLQSGEGRNGPWKKQDFIMETQGQFPKKVCVSLWGDRIDQADIHIEENIKIYADIESREFNGKWYTDVKAWKVEKVLAPMEIPGEQALGPALTPEEPVDDLPF